MKRAVIISSRENPFKLLAAELEERGTEVILLAREDVDSYEKLQAKCDEIGKIDVLFYSALCDKKLEGKRWIDMTTDEYQQWKYYGFVHFYEVNRSFVKGMTDNGGGKIIAIGSEAGVVPSIYQAANGAASAGLFMCIRNISVESAQDKIYTNAISVGAVDSNQDFRPMTDDCEMLRHLPSGRTMSPEDVVKKIADIAEKTDEIFTGNVISIDNAFENAYMREW